MANEQERSASLAKQEALEVIGRLPEDASAIDVIYEVYVVRNRRLGLDAPGKDKETVVADLSRRLMLTGEP